MLISQLKAEIFEIQQRDKDFLALRDQLHSIQARHRHLQDEKLMQENDFRNRHDSNRQTVLSLKKEADDLRFHLNEKTRHSNDIHNEISANRDQISRKEVDINSTQRDLSSKSDHSYALRKDIDTLSYEAAKLREEKAKD